MMTAKVPGHAATTCAMLFMNRGQHGTSCRLELSCRYAASVIVSGDSGRAHGHNCERDELTEWALAARGGDVIAQAAFVRMSQADVWRLCAALCSPGEADDVAQETYLRAFRALPSFLARSGARTWLLSIARRSCADHIRGLKRHRRLDAMLRRAIPPVEPDPATRYAAEDLLTQLPDDRRSAFVLTAVLGMSYLEAARIEDVPIGTIRSRVARAREELVAALVHAETI